jgi:hypothetical protein
MQLESYVLARKPLSEGSVAQNVLKWGTGGINIDGSRIGTETITINGQGNDKLFHGNFSGNIENNTREGRFPANLILECTCDKTIQGKEIKGNENYKWNNTTGSGEIFNQRGLYTPRTETPEIHTNPECPCYIMDSKSGTSKSSPSKGGKRSSNFLKEDNRTAKGAGIFAEGSISFPTNYNDEGGASRYFKIIK